MGTTVAEDGTMQSSVPEPAPVLSAYLRGARSINRLPADFVWKFSVHRALLNPPCMYVYVCVHTGDHFSSAAN